MGLFLLRRILGMAITLWVILTVSFFFIRLAPGGPFLTERNLPEEVVHNLERQYGLDQPLLIQYLKYIGNFARGDLGFSMNYLDRDILYFIQANLPVSMFLGVVTLIYAVIIGLSSGVCAALRQNSWLDYLVMAGATVGISVPIFVVGPVLMYIFAMKLQWLPTSGWIHGRNGSWLNMIMPVIALGFPVVANIARLMRASVLETLQSDFIRTAYAKGLSTTRIVLRHVLRASITPVISYLGPAFAGIVTGSVVVETIFRIPGLGKLFVQSSFNRDYTMIMGLVLVYSSLLILSNFVVDILYAYIDPRVGKRR